MARTPKKYLLASLIEHESCVSLKSTKCWSPTSRLKSSREEGAGLLQLTRAYNADGSLRFDTIKELKYKHPFSLKDLTWSNVYTRPDLQIRAGVLMMKANYRYFYSITRDEYNSLAFADAAYNGGIGGVDRERRACNIATRCDPNIWFDNVERFCMKSKVALYGNRSACDINRYHVKDVLVIRAPKYINFLK